MPQVSYYLEVIKSSIRRNGVTGTLARIFTVYDLFAHRRYKHQYRRFCQNLSDSSKIAIILTSVLYEKHLNQRVINLSRYLVGKGYIIFFVNWRWSPYHVAVNPFGEVDKNTFYVPLYSVDVSELTRFRQVIAVCTMVNRFIVHLSKQVRRIGGCLYYDIHDDWEEFKKVGFADWYSGRQDEELLIRMADRVSAVTKHLASKFEDIRQDMIISPNGYASEVIGKNNRDIVRPIADQVVVGYFGHLTSQWINWPFVFRLSQVEKVKIEVIGNGVWPGLLKEFRRYGITYHGIVPVDQLHRYVRSWHFGLVPFKTGPLSSAADPLKVYEYIYYGLTCLVTGIHHLKAYPNCLFFEDDETPGYRFLFDHHRLSGKGETDRFLQANTWEKQFDKLFASALR